MSGDAIMAALIGALLGAVAAWGLLRMRRASQDARWRADMQVLATQALRDNADVFLQMARETLAREQDSQAGSWRERELALQALIEPIRSALSRTEVQVRTLENERREAFASLRTQIEALARSGSGLQQETRNLVSALRRPEVRGRWGELTLRRVVELAGLSEHCDFTEQVGVAGTRGAQRPDLIVRMPEERVLVVDAKTPIDAYLDAIDAPTEDGREAALGRHASQVEARVRDLGGKAYWEQFEHSPEFAVLFLPGDQFLSAALAQRPGLLENAIRQRVILATPSTLIALLKTVAYGWRQSAVAENAAAIRDLGQDLHQRLATFTTQLAKSGRALGNAVEAYNQAIGSLERHVLPGARRFTELKAVGDTAIAAPEPVEQLVRELAAGTEGGAVTDAARPGPPEPGSRRYFVLLYTPASQREQLSTLLDVADEIGTDPAVGADHGVAHARLQWWQHEAERFAQGQPQHPWLRALLRDHPQAVAVDLRPLVDAAAMDLATRTLSQGDGTALARALFAAAARLLLTTEPEPGLQAAIGELGAAMQALEREPTDAAARTAATKALPTIEHERQHSLTPLLVWLALAASGPPLRSRLGRILADNFRAWSAARRAARGRFRLS